MPKSVKGALTQYGRRVSHKKSCTGVHCTTCGKCATTTVYRLPHVCKVCLGVSARSRSQEREGYLTKSERRLLDKIELKVGRY